MYKIILLNSARKSLKRIPSNMRKKIGEEIDKLSFNPFIGKKLEGDLQGRYAIRVWPYRILYRIERKIVTVFILDIGHRQGIYK